MPNTAPGAQRLAGGAEDDATPAVSARPAARAWRWAAVAVFLLVAVAVFDAFLHLSKTYPENSDEANILLMADDMLHGNVALSGWNVSDVPFITTELPQIAVLVGIFGLSLNTAHIAAALTYTLVVAVGMLLAKGRAHGPAAVARMALALAIMLAPQPGVGVFVVIFSVGHIGTALPVMLTWLVIDRLWPPGQTGQTGQKDLATPAEQGPSRAQAALAALRRRWYVPVIVAVLLGWALMADPLVLVVAILPLLVICLVRLVSSMAGGALRGGGLRGMGLGLLERLFEVALAVAAGAGYAIVVLGRRLLDHAGGYHQQPVPYALDATRTWFWHTRVVVHGLLEMFGAYFVPGQDPQYPMSHLDQLIAVTRLLTVVLAVWAACAIARRMFFRDADFISQLLLAGIVANIFAYIPSTLADHTALNTREIAPVLPFAAVLAGRMLGDRLVSGPLATIRLRRAGRSPYSLRLRLMAVPLVALFGWYSYGLFQQADTPAAPLPLAQLAAFLEANHLHYGLGGYWEASVLTVETGGSVTVRAVTPACIQPYKWESKQSWYYSSDHYANFLLLSQKPGYFTQWEASGAALDLLNKWYGPPNYPRGWPRHYNFGGYFMAPASTNPSQLVKIYYYVARQYPGNLLANIPQMKKQMNNPPAVVCD